MCEACERGDHDQCGMQTWCECDCQGADGVYIPDPDDERQPETRSEAMKRHHVLIAGPSMDRQRYTAAAGFGGTWYVRDRRTGRQVGNDYGSESAARLAAERRNATK